VQHVHSINKNLVSGSLLCRDDFKVVIESNKFVILKCGCRCLFHFSISDFCNKFVNNICDSINESDASICHSCLCHLNFGSMSGLSSLNLILNLSIIKGSKRQSCVQSKQPRKPHKAAEERHLPPLELIYSDICEMNGVLTDGEQRYFMTMIDDVPRYCYETYKAEVENSLEKKIKHFRFDHGGEYFFNEFDLFCSEHGIIHEMTSPHSPQSNGVAKRKNYTLTDLVNFMLDTAGLSKAWWGGFIDFMSCPKYSFHED
jgi:hypothetical protein